MSFLKKLFGGSAGTSDGDKVLGEENYKGYVIRALEMNQNGEFLLSGVVEKEISGVVKQHRFVRADRLPSADEALKRSIAKGQQLVDEQGDRMFQ